MTKKTYIVTGGAGFIGSHLADSLVNDAHNVVIIDDLSSGYEDNIGIIGAPIGGPLLHASFGNILDDPFIAGKIISLLSCTGVVFTSFFITKNLFLIGQP